MTTWLPLDSMSALRTGFRFEPDRCDSRSLLLFRMPLSADFKEKPADARKTSLERALNRGAPSAAEHQLKWLDALAASARFRRFSLWTDHRMALGLANGVLENAGLDLHRLFGTPEISGSKLKGVALDTAIQSVQAGTLSAEERMEIFGYPPDDKRGRAGGGGMVGFLPGLPARPDCRIELDVLTVHYPEYYRGKQSDTDDDDPIPSLFPVVAEGEEFVFHLLCRASWLPDEKVVRLLDGAETCLRLALRRRGVGGKTRAGYGRFRETLERVASPEPADDLFSSAPVPAGATSVSGTESAAPVPGTPDTFISEWAGKLAPDAIKRFAEAIRNLPPDQRRAAFDACVPPMRRIPSDPLWQNFKSRHHGKTLLRELKLD